MRRLCIFQKQQKNFNRKRYNSRAWAPAWMRIWAKRPPKNQDKKFLENLKGADMVFVTCGLAEEPDPGRLRLLPRSQKVLAF